MIKLTYKEEGTNKLQTVITLTYAVLHQSDGVYLYYAPEGVKSMSDHFDDVVIKLDVHNHHLLATTIK